MNSPGAYADNEPSCSYYANEDTTEEDIPSLSEWKSVLDLDILDDEINHIERQQTEMIAELDLLHQEHHEKYTKLKKQLDEMGKQVEEMEEMMHRESKWLKGKMENTAKLYRRVISSIGIFYLLFLLQLFPDHQAFVSY